jgi:endonuclease/exonuclease/phosphatase family metal-dependent hydrolase
MLRHRLISVPLAAALGLGLLPTATPALSTSEAAEVAVTSRSSRENARTLRVATFNVRTARATGDRRNWLRRAPDVAREILSRNPGVVALQELGPGRADGRTGRLHGHLRQTTSLLNNLDRLGGGRYRLVRSTAYVAPGTSHGTQGARILYDSSRYRLLTRCVEQTGRSNYNASCSFELPVASGDGSRHRRSAAYAEFADRRTGCRFFVVSAHLDNRHSGSSSEEAKLNRLRARQAAVVSSRMAALNSHHRPVVFGGDINSWRNDRGGYAPHRVLQSKGFSDTATAPVRINYAYPTVNHFRTALRRSSSGSGVRLDVLLVKGAGGARRYENKMARVDHARPSDHNMGVADIGL